MSEARAFPPGLCARCCHAETLASKHSRFLRCRRADVDARFARYPHLPVVACAGREELEPGPAERPEGSAGPAS